MKDWYLLMKIRSLAEATIFQGMLEENNIPVHILNKKDSIYLLGDFEVYVPVTLKDLAKDLLNNTLLN
jgi:hypothetical protein